MGDVLPCFSGVNFDVLVVVIVLCSVNFLVVKSCFLGVSDLIVGVVFLTGWGKLWVCGDIVSGRNVWLSGCVSSELDSGGAERE